MVDKTGTVLKICCLLTKENRLEFKNSDLTLSPEENSIPLELRMKPVTESMPEKERK